MLITLPFVFLALVCLWASVWKQVLSWVLGLMGHVLLGQRARGSGALQQDCSWQAAFAKELISRSRFSHVNCCRRWIVLKRVLQVIQPAQDLQKTHLLGKALGKLGPDFFVSLWNVYYFMFVAVIMYTWTRGNLTIREAPTYRTSNLKAVGLKHLLLPWKPKMNVIASVSLVKCPSLNCFQMSCTSNPWMQRCLGTNKSILNCQGWWDSSLVLGPLSKREGLIAHSVSVHFRSCISRTVTGMTAASAASSAIRPWSMSPSC